MTHTLHRIKRNGEPEHDFVILAMPARGVNNDDQSPDKLKHFLRIFQKNNAVNMGGIGSGHLYDSKPEEVIEHVYRDMPMVHGVFTNREDLIGALKDIKEADMGISIIVSGLIDEVDYCAAEAGMKRHSVNYSLGIWGDKSKLPDQKYLEITTMCGHAMISPQFVGKMVDDIRKGRKTIEKAALELAKPCVCGIFNAANATEVLARLV